jgi:hypothetical protein
MQPKAITSAGFVRKAIRGRDRAAAVIDIAELRLENAAQTVGGLF